MKWDDFLRIVSDEDLKRLHQMLHRAGQKAYDDKPHLAKIRMLDDDVVRENMRRGQK